MTRSPRRFTSLFYLALVLVSFQTGSFAQQSAVFPVIVVLDDAAPFDTFRSYYLPDERAAANPAAWSYLDVRVTGLVQFLEARHGFRADRVYSAAIRGFAARLTASQIADFERDPYVAYVERDRPMRIVAQTLPWGVNKVDADISSTRAGDGTGYCRQCERLHHRHRYRHRACGFEGRRPCELCWRAEPGLPRPRHTCSGDSGCEGQYQRRRGRRASGIADWRQSVGLQRHRLNVWRNRRRRLGDGERKETRCGEYESGGKCESGTRRCGAEICR